MLAFGFHEGRTLSRYQKQLLSCILAVFTAAIGVVLPEDRSAKSQAYNASEDELVDIHQISLTLHKSRTFKLHKAFSSAVVGSPDIADVLPISDKVLYVQGKKVGTTNISVFDKDKQLVGVLDVEVTIDIQNIAQKIRASTESPGIRISSNHEQVVLSGEAKNAADAERAVSIAQGFMKGLLPKSTAESTVVNLMRIAPSQQVLLKVRFLEASRDAGRDLGVNWFVANRSGTRGFNTGLGGSTQAGQFQSGSNGVGPTPGGPFNIVANPSDPTNSKIVPTGGGLPLFQALGTFAGSASSLPFGVALANLANSGANVDVLITALETKGLARELAEPDLVALSGDTASFLAGGEIPVPVVQPSSGGTTNITVEYKPFGVQLTFVPTVLANGIINLRMTPSVSQLDYTNAIRNEGFLIPALTKREARTTIELRDGQSFAIAGLLQSEGLRNISQMPWIGSVPILGALFRSAAYQEKETDLVVIVTPHLVAPAAPGQRLATPLDQSLPSNDVDFFLRGEAEVPKKYSEYITSGGGLAGPYGHMIFLDDK